MLKWKDEYSIGVEEIDNQHKHLFEIGNSAYELLKDEFKIDKYDEVIDIIEQLREYTQFHFKAEEEYMLEKKYIGYFEQKKQHDAFIKKINSVDLRNIDQDQDKYIKDLLEFVFNWIIDHILKKDKMINND